MRAIVAGLKGRGAVGGGDPRSRRFRRRVADGDDRVGRATHRVEGGGRRGRRPRHARAHVLPGTGESVGESPTETTESVVLPKGRSCSVTLGLTAAFSGSTRDTKQLNPYGFYYVHASVTHGEVAGGAHPCRLRSCAVSRRLKRNAQTDNCPNGCPPHRKRAPSPGPWWRTGNLPLGARFQAWLISPRRPAGPRGAPA